LKKQGCQIFLDTRYEIGEKYTEFPQNTPKSHKISKKPRNRPNGHKIYQHLPLQDPPRITQFGIFGLKLYHLATLM
jgi:hypothetical protein